MEKLRSAVFGLGRIANSGHLPAIAACKDVIDLIAVVDPIEERAKAAFDKYGAKKMYLSQEDALSDPEIEAVALCLPHFLHAPVTVAACKSGKHVLVEKPMAIDTEGADEMIAAADAAGGLLIPLQGSHAVDFILWMLEKTPTRSTPKDCRMSDISSVQRG